MDFRQIFEQRYARGKDTEEIFSQMPGLGATKLKRARREESKMRTLFDKIKTKLN